MPPLPPKQLIASVGVSKTDYEQVVEICRQWALEKKHGGQSGHYICVTSVHGIVTAEDDPEFARILNNADIVTPDGMPIVWALRSFGSPRQQRVYGPTLMLDLCRSAAAHGHRIFLYGGREETLQVLAHRLRQQFPELVIADAYAPPFRPLTPAEKHEVRRRILHSGSDLVFVGISTPKQERWMYENRDFLPGVTLVGVGAAFDFHAGRTRQAPAFMQRNGLEWLFRLAMEPARLWRRYLLITPRFVPLIFKQKLRSISR